jgi:WD40 repeat protein
MFTRKTLLLSGFLALTWVIGAAPSGAIGPNPARLATLALAVADTDEFGDKLPPKDALKRIGTVRFHAGDKLLSLAYSPDGDIIASGGRNDPVRLWNAKTGQLVRTLPEHMVWALAFSPDGAQLATGGANKVVRLWDVKTGQEIKQMKGHKATIKALAFSVDGVAIVSAGDDGLVQLWRAADGVEIASYEGHTFGVNCVAIAPDLKTLASGSTDRTIRVWNGKTTVLTAPSAITGVAYLKGRDALVSAGDDGFLRIWDLKNAKQIREWKGHADSITHLVLSDDGKTLATAGADKLVKLWDMTGGAEIRSIARKQGDCEAFAMTPDAKQIASAGANSAIRRWDATSGNALPGVKGPDGVISAVACAPDGSLYAVGQTTNEVLLLDATGNEKHRLVCGPDDAEVMLGFSGDGKTLATVSVPDTIVLWDTTTGRETKRFTLPDRDEVRCLAYSPNGLHLAVGYTNGGVRIWEASTGKVTKQMPLPRGARAIAYARDGKALAVGSEDVIVLYDGSTFEEQRRYSKLNDTISCLAFSPDGRILASGMFANTIRLFDLTLPPKTEIEPRALEGHLGVVNALAWSANGRCLATAGFDRTVRLWEFVNGQPIAVWPGHIGEATAVTFHPTGRIVISGGRDATLLVWDATCLGQNGKLPDVKPVDAATLDTLWKGMASDNNAQGNTAMWSMMAAKDAADWLEKSKKIFLENPEKIKKYMEDLNSDKFKEREAANQALANYGRWVEGVLKRALDNPPSEEVRQRVDKLLGRLEGKDSISLQQERLRVRRAIEMLEQSATPGSRGLLQKLAAGAAEDDLRDMAQSAVERLGKR